MTTIERLRELACDINEEEIRSHSVITLNQGRYNRQFRLDVNHDWLNAWHAEFERILQAIAATLGDADLAAENAELREDLEFERSENGWAREFLNRMGQKCGTEDCPSLVAYVTKLESENANLRELVRDVNRAAHMLCEAWEGSCSKEAEGMSLHAVCPIGDTSELCVFGKLYDRMRDLGAEVD